MLHERRLAEQSNFLWLLSFIRVSAIVTCVWLSTSLLLGWFGVSHHNDMVVLAIIWGMVLTALFWGVLVVVLMVAGTRWSLKQKQLRRQEE